MFLTIHSRCSSLASKRNGLRDTAPESGQNLRLSICINTAPGVRHPSNTHLHPSSTHLHLIMLPWPKASQATDMPCLSKLFQVLPGFEKHRTAFMTCCIMARHGFPDLASAFAYIRSSGFLFYHPSCLHLDFFSNFRSRYPSIARFISDSLAKMVPFFRRGCFRCFFKTPLPLAFFSLLNDFLLHIFFEIPTPLALLHI